MSTPFRRQTRSQGGDLFTGETISNPPKPRPSPPRSKRRNTEPNIENPFNPTTTTILATTKSLVSSLSPLSTLQACEKYNIKWALMFVLAGAFAWIGSGTLRRAENAYERDWDVWREIGLFEGRL